MDWQEKIYDEPEAIKEDHERHIPMCCGTPLQNDKCKICGSDYSEEETF